MKWHSPLTLTFVVSLLAALRQRLCLAGLYGTRASLLAGNPVTFPFPPYLASLVVSERPDDLEPAGHRVLAEAVFHTLRPYGGLACVWGLLADRGGIDEIVQGEGFPGASVRQAGEFVLLARSGPLPGAADWSHAEANAASTGASEDQLRSPASQNRARPFSGSDSPGTARRDRFPPWGSLRRWSRSRRSRSNR